MPNIQINIKNKVARADKAIIVCDNSDYTAVFDFDAEWDAYTTKTARFVYDGKYTDVVFTGNECSIPVIQDPRSLSVGVYAGDLHTTTPAYISCVPSILFGNGIPADPTPDVYAQIMELLGKISDESVAKAVTDALEQAKVSGEFDGEKGNDGVSPAVSVAAITGGNRVTITDAEGAKTFDVMDGAQGASGADGKDYVLTDADKQEIAKTAAGLVDVPSVQPDWNQNDSTQPDYIKNRPFYTGNPVETVLVEERSAEFVNKNNLYIAEFRTDLLIYTGQTYNVYWDGTVYNCVCGEFQNIPYIGNLGIAGADTDTGEPFIFLSNPNGGQSVAASTGGSHTFAITELVPEVIKIDEKYLPVSTDNSYGVVKKAEIVSAYNFPKNAPHDQMVDAITAFKTGNASIVWDGLNVIHAKYNSSSDTILVVFAKGPMRLFTYSNNGGFYNKTLGSDTYGELQGNQVRIINDGGAYTVLSTEGVQSDTILRVGAKKLSVSGEIGGDALVLMSSTADSTKKFRITVDDSGTITTTEVS